MARTCATYPLTVEHATDIIIELRLSPLETFVEPSRTTGYLFDDLPAATAFRLRFDAERWQSKDEEVHLMCAPDDPEVAPWLAECGSHYRQVEFVVIQFGSSKDCERFEGALCGRLVAAIVE